jgi:colicin import membrane protein
MKRRFEFRLERVRAVRDLEERVARAERAQAEALARAAEASRDEARTVLEESRAHLRSLLDGELDPREVLAAQRALDGELAELRRRIESARTQRLQAERMAAAHRERKSAAKALEELRERARKRHGAELEKHDNSALDEVAERLAAARRAAGAAKEEGASRSDAPVADQDPGRPRDPRAA